MTSQVIRMGRSVVVSACRLPWQVLALQLLVRQVPTVQPVMLYNEKDVKQNGKESQSELGGVTEYRAPVVVVDADEEHLEDGEGSACEVKKNVSNAPAYCALSPRKIT